MLKILLNPNDWLARHPKVMALIAFILFLLLCALEDLA